MNKMEKKCFRKEEEKRKGQQEKKIQTFVFLPKLTQKIIFKEKGVDDWISARVVKAFRKTSKYKNCRHLELKDGGVIQRDFIDDIEQWKEEPEPESEDEDIPDTFYLNDILGEKESIEYSDDVFPVKVLSRTEFKRPEIQEAMQAEIVKFKNFKAFKEVNDEGQYNIPIRWVVTEQKKDGKNQPYKARLCIRGDKEKGKEFIRADSPTASKETLKLALIVAAMKGLK